MIAITPAQIRAIHTIVSRLRLPDEEYRAILARFGVESSKSLSRDQAGECITYLKCTYRLSSRSRPTPPARAPRPHVVGRREDAPPAAARGQHSAGKIVHLPTPAQIGFIEALKQEVAWRVEGGYELWLQRNLGLTRITTREQAARVIEGLKGLKRHDLARARPAQEAQLPGG